MKHGLVVSSCSTKSEPTVLAFVLLTLVHHVQRNILNWMSQRPTTTITHCNTTLNINDWYLLNQLLCIASVHVFNILTIVYFVFREIIRKIEKSESQK